MTDRKSLRLRRELLGDLTPAEQLAVVAGDQAESVSCYSCRPETCAITSISILTRPTQTLVCSRAGR